MNSPSCSIVGFRNTGAVSRMKSIQNWPGNSGSSGAGPSRISRSSKPCASRLPAKLSSTMNTTRWPRSRSTWPMPTQLFVGPYAPSGKNTIVRPSATAPPLFDARSSLVGMIADAAGWHDLERLLLDVDLVAHAGRPRDRYPTDQPNDPVQHQRHDRCHEDRREHQVRPK